MPQIIEVPLEQMEEEPFNNLLLPLELEEDPFIEQESNNRDYTEPHKLDHQDSIMTEDQIR